MQNIPKDLVRYQLLPFLTLHSAVKLTRSSQPFFCALRHIIYRTGHVTVYHFIRQSNAQSKHIGICTSVIVESKLSFEQLLQHVIVCDKPHESGRKVVTLLNLIICFNAPLDNTVFPDGLQSLNFAFHFDQSVCGIVLPATLHTLVFGCYFSSSLTRVTLPPRLHTLRIERNLSLAGVTLPSHLHTLQFGCYFNQSLSGISLPVNLQSLEFGSWYNECLSGITLPASLHTLTLGSCFKRSLRDITFPPKLVIHKRGLPLARTLVPPELHIKYI